MKTPQAKYQYTATAPRESHEWADFRDQRHVPDSHSTDFRSIALAGTTDGHTPLKLSSLATGFERLNGPPDNDGRLEMYGKAGFIERNNTLDRN